MHPCMTLVFVSIGIITWNAKLFGYKNSYTLHDPSPIATCLEGEFLCTTSQRCIDESVVCNGVADCGDGSDDINCGKRTVICCL